MGAKFIARLLVIFFFNDTATTEIYTLSLHDALPISLARLDYPNYECVVVVNNTPDPARSEEHTSELQSPKDLVCRLLLEKKTCRARIGAMSQLSPTATPNTAPARV